MHSKYCRVRRIQIHGHAFSVLVGCFGFNGPLRQYFSLYRAVSQREGERGERIDESKNVQTTPTRTYCKRNRLLSYCNPNCRTPRHWKFTQHHRTTRPPTFFCLHYRLGQLLQPVFASICGITFSKFYSLRKEDSGRSNLQLPIQAVASSIPHFLVSSKET